MQVASYASTVPRLWDDTIEAHRRAVRDATLDATAALVRRHGLRSVTMSQIAQQTGIGRATLYKYFPDVEAILVAWHERQVGAHVERLAALRDRAGDARERLQAVLTAYALSRNEHDAGELAALLHRGAPPELAAYCLHALAAARDLRSQAAVRRLVAVTLDGLRGAPGGPSRKDATASRSPPRAPR